VLAYASFHFSISTGLNQHYKISKIVSSTKVFGFDLNEHWQADRDQYDNQKIDGLTPPRAIRQSAFRQKLGIEGCDPLSLPVTALLFISRPITTGFGSWLMVGKST
jgi:hypothetical protein